MNRIHTIYNSLPIKLSHGSHINWLQAGSIRYTDPFFDETIIRLKALPENNKPFKSTSVVEMIKEWNPQVDSVQPSAIIFHVSRCGSTLLSQLLGLDATNIVLAEVPFLDDLLRARFKPNGNDLSAFLPYAIHFYGQKRNGQEQRLFIKTDSWHLFFYEQYRSLYPNTPFVLLYRKPDEVIRSQMKRKGLHAIPGLIEEEIFELGELPSITEGHEDYVAAVLEQYYAQMLNIKKTDHNTILYNYKDGINQLAQQLLQMFGATIGIEQQQAIAQRAKYNAKEPMELFGEECQQTIGCSKQLSRAFEVYETLVSLHKEESMLA